MAIIITPNMARAVITAIYVALEKNDTLSGAEELNVADVTLPKSVTPEILFENGVINQANLFTGFGVLDEIISGKGI